MGKDVTKLLMPTPDNLKAGRARMVDSDLYGICDQLKKFDKNLCLVYHENHDSPWVVMEIDNTGTERFVSRYKHLGSYILDDLRYMLSVPFERRLEALQKKLDAENAKNDGLNEEGWERFLWDFDKAARKSNLYDPVWDKSFPKIKPKQRMNGSN